MNKSINKILIKYLIFLSENQPGYSYPALFSIGGYSVFSLKVVKKYPALFFCLVCFVFS